MATVRGADLQVGDVVDFLGSFHRVLDFYPYEGKLLDDGTLPPGTRIALCSGEVGMTVWPEMRVEVER